MVTDEQALANKIRVQSEGVQSWVANKYRGTLVWATGVGKSRGSILCMEELMRTTDAKKGLLVVPTEEMRDVDWPAEFTKWNFDSSCLKIICYHSLAKETLNNYDFIVYDECHRLTLSNLQKLYHYRRPALGLTATFPNAKFEEEEERVAMITELLPPVHSVSTDEAVELGLISDFEVVVLYFFLDSQNRNIHGGTKKNPKMTTEKMEYTRLTKVIQMSIIRKIDGLKFGAIAKRTQFLYNLPSKTRLAKECLNRIMEPPKRTLVLCGSIAQANELCQEHVFHSESTDEALLLFQNKEIHCLAAVKALNEGKNLVELEQELIVQVDSQERNLVQRIGRTVRKRLGNPEFKARVIILVAANTADEKWYKSAIKEFDTSRIKEYTVVVPPVHNPVSASVA